VIHEVATLYSDEDSLLCAPSYYSHVLIMPEAREGQDVQKNLANVYIDYKARM
jgi:hypothetical protein